MRQIPKFMHISLGIPQWKHSLSLHRLNRFKPNLLKPIDINGRRDPSFLNFFLMFLQILILFIIVSLHLLIFYTFDQILFLFVTQILGGVVGVVDRLVLLGEFLVYYLEVDFGLFVCVLGYGFDSGA